MFKVKKFFSILISLMIMLTLVYQPNSAYIGTAHATDIAYYVSPSGNDSTGNGSIGSPYKTITKARDVIRAFISGGMTGNITVYLRGGSYFQTSKVSFNESDSGRNGYTIKYTNYTGEEPIIYGGEKLTGWTLHSGSIYKKNVGTDWSSNYLTENGVLGTKARYPNSGYKTVAAPYVSSDPRNKFHFSPGDIPSISNLSDAEIYVWPGGPEGTHNWFAGVVPIATIDDVSNLVGLESPAFYELGVGTRYFVQGAIELLDQPGEFYLDTNAGMLYYWPMNPNIETLEIAAARSDTLFEFKGSSTSNLVQNIIVEGITFSTSNYIDDYESAGLITLENAQYITVANSKLHNSGTNGILGVNYVKNNTFSGNLIYDIGVSGVFLHVKDGQLGDNLSQYNTITNNHIYNLGQTIGHGNGIELKHSGYNTVSYNRIHDSKRFGIRVVTNSLEYGGTIANSETKGNVFEFNDLFNCMTDSQDGGLFYTWGTTTENTFRNNMLHDSNVYFSYGFGYYNDDDTDRMNAHDNLIYGLQRQASGGALNAAVVIRGTNNKFNNNVVANNPLTTLGALEYFTSQTSTGGRRNTTNIEVNHNIIFNSAPTDSLNHWYDGVIHHNLDWNTGRFGSVDYNLAFNSTGGHNVQTTNQLENAVGWSRWQTIGFDTNYPVGLNALGYDTHSIAGQNPQFMDAAQSDYRLKPNSPAYALGYHDINAEPMGLLSTFNFTDSSESIDKLFIKSATTNAGNATVEVLSNSTVQLTVSGRTLSGYLLPNLAGYTTYASADSAIASVNSSGLVTANAPGIAKITATVTKNAIVKTVDIYIKTAEAAPTPAPTLPFSDNFESESDTWTEVVGAWDIITDGTQVYTQTNAVGEAFATAGNPSWSNYSVSADVKRLSGTSAAIVGRLFANDQFYQFEITGTHWFIYKNDRAQWTQLAGGSYNSDTSTFYNLKMEFNSSNITAFINDIEVGTATDSTFSTGKIGLRQYSSTAKYDNVSVQSIEEAPTPNALLSGPDYVLAGNTLDMTYSLVNVTSNVYAKELTVNFDPTILQYEGASSLIDGFDVILDSQTPGKVRIIEASTGPDSGFSGTIDLLLLHFLALTPGEGDIYLTDVKVADDGGNVTDLDVGLAHHVVITDRAALNEKITEAVNSITNAQIHETLWGHYKQSVVNALNTANQNANLVTNNVAASQTQVDAAEIALAASLETFRNAVNATASIGDLSLVASNYGASSTSSNWATIQMYDLDHDNKLDIVDLVAIARIILGII
ncbi:hypothetical protein EHS13_05740 [Paenibacillus psychroresistens]|uniref:Probable pectate lyase C n=1 Tax=Paenibacillus psychroresistens TaxID=1778678 RepID=A0A6B8RDC9_9BACL|nr:Ig-like domain-containing protein [Paenibacillus psychroresistens]QGQ94441.1 hypothetical protein EHS13_05740 [Paenibacillus psychroresistens]